MASLLQKAFDKQTLLACKGYNPVFIDGETEIGVEKILTKEMRSNLPKVEGNAHGILNYTGLSVLYDMQRRVPFFSAYNIDGAHKQKVTRTSFRPDPRIDGEIQLSQKGFYDLIVNKTEFEIGHMAANNEMAWGNEAQLQSYQTFHFPNSSPQAEKLNTGIWKTLETYIIEESASSTGNKKICVFTGPLLRKGDPQYVKDPSFRIPLLFFKVVVFPTQKGIFSTAFMMSHEQKMIDDNMFVKKPVDSKEMIRTMEDALFTDFKYKRVFQVNIGFLEQQTRLKFSWKGVQNIEVPNDKNQIKKIRKIRDAEDARAANVGSKGGLGEMVFPGKDVTATETKSKNFRLNIILP